MNSLNKRLEDKAREVFDTIVKRNPALATHLGIHKYDDKLTDMSRERVLEDIGLHEKWLGELRSFNREVLSKDYQVDLDALVYLLELELYHEKEIRNWERNPYLLSDLLDHIEPLLRKDFAPLNERMGLVAGRADKAGQYLEQLRTLVGDAPDRLWCDMAIEACGQASEFLTSIPESAATSGGVSQRTIETLNKAVAKANKALQAHRQWLEEEVKPKAVMTWPLGRSKFEKLLGKRLLGKDSAEILTVGERLLKEKKDELREIAREVLKEAEVGPESDMIKQARALVQSEHPENFGQALEAYRESIEESRQFVIDHDLATLPEGESLTVTETPTYLRPTTPLAAYISPGKLDKKQEGFYLVTPREDMGQFNYPDIRNTTVHEGYPGHHLQLCCANLNPRLARALLNPTETIEGWAHYCEEMMKQHGYRNSAKDRFVRVSDEVWRAARIVLDVQMHQGAVDFEKAIQFLVDEVGMNRSVARSEVKRYTFTPSYQLSYLIGKLLIKELKEKVKRKKARFNEKEFHNRLLHAGSLPIKLMEREFGV